MGILIIRIEELSKDLEMARNDQESLRLANGQLMAELATLRERASHFPEVEKERDSLRIRVLDVE